MRSANAAGRTPTNYASSEFLLLRGERRAIRPQFSVIVLHADLRMVGIELRLEAVIPTFRGRKGGLMSHKRALLRRTIVPRAVGTAHLAPRSIGIHASALGHPLDRGHAAM